MFNIVILYHYTIKLIIIRQDIIFAVPGFIRISTCFSYQFLLLSTSILNDIDAAGRTVYLWIFMCIV